MKKLVFTTLVLLSMLSCGNKNTGTEDKTNTDTTALAPEKNEIKSTESNWGEFWTTFQAAVASGDKAKVEAFVDLSAIGKKSFDDTYEMYFTGSAKDKIAKTKAAEATPTKQEFEGLNDLKDIVVINFSENGTDEEGNSMESLMQYYFAKVEGKYKLVYLMAAG